MLQAMILFAQFQQKGGPKGGETEATIAMAAVCCFYAVVFILAIGFAIFHLMTMYKALSAVSPRNRDMEPGQIFLLFIPFFGIVWQFFVVLRTSSSLEKEFDDRGISGDGGDFGKTLGLWALILNLVGCAPVGLILFIIYLFKIRGYTATLTSRRRDDDD